MNPVFNEGEKGNGMKWGGGPGRKSNPLQYEVSKSRIAFRSAVPVPMYSPMFPFLFFNAYKYLFLISYFLFTIYYLQFTLCSSGSYSYQPTPTFAFTIPISQYTRTDLLTLLNLSFHRLISCLFLHFIVLLLPSFRLFHEGILRQFGMLFSFHLRICNPTRHSACQVQKPNLLHTSL